MYEKKKKKYIKKISHRKNKLEKFLNYNLGI